MHPEDWHYEVTPKLWDTDEAFTDQLNLCARIGFEFVGAVEIDGFEHHVWRQLTPRPRAQAGGWSGVIGTLAKKFGASDRADAFLRRLEPPTAR
jgi:hypothetical protein